MLNNYKTRIYYKHYTLFPIVTPLTTSDKNKLVKYISQSGLSNNFWRYCEHDNAIGLNRYSHYNVDDIFPLFQKIVAWLNKKNYYLCGSFYYRTFDRIYSISAPNNDDYVHYISFHHLLKNTNTCCLNDTEKIINDAAYIINNKLKKSCFYKLLNKINNYTATTYFVPFVIGFVTCLYFKK